MKMISQNKKANFDYFLSDNLECGIVLEGDEIKNILQYGINLKESYVKIINNEMWIIGANISGITINPDSLRTRPLLRSANDYFTRSRKLLLHKRQINKFAKLTQEKSTTIICTKAYVDDNGKVKLEIALGKGKKQHDKRNTIKERDLERAQ